MSYNSFINTRAWRLRKFFSQSENENVQESPISNNQSVIEIENDLDLNDTTRHALVFGGSGSLGSKCIFDLKAAGWWIASVDYNANLHADTNIIIMRDEENHKQELHITAAIKSILGMRKLQLIFCTNCAFHDTTVSEESLLKVGNDMWQDHVVPSLICASLAKRFLKRKGMLVLLSSLSALKPKGDTLAVSLANNAVIQLAKCLATLESGMPSQTIVVCLLPLYLDTTLMRSVHGHVDYGNFTPLQFISDLILGWLDGKEVPSNGSLCQLVTNHFITDCIVHK